MNLFEKYETEIKPFTAGKRFICTNPERIQYTPEALNEIIQILEREQIPRNSVRYRVLAGTYKNRMYRISIDELTKGYTPYDGEVTE